ncbi:MAG: hypothetical protein WBK77_06780 [Alphaproteobacteria bacterium]
MKNWGKILGLVALLGVGIAVAAEVVSKEQPISYSWHYKMTVTVETPEGIKSGSAVREVSVTMEPQSQDPDHPYYPKKTLKGEAVVVDLGGRGKLFALLSGPWLGVNHADSIVFHAFPMPDGGGGLTLNGVKYYSTLKNAKAVLRFPLYPALVTFTDLNDPKSVTPVLEVNCSDPGGACSQQEMHIKADRFEELFGKGVRLKDITIEMTDENISTGLISILKWLPEYYDRMLDGLRYNTYKSQSSFANSLASGAFSTEESPYE